MAAPDNVPSFAAPREDLKPISITQPEGASFTVEGHHVAWQKWSVRVGFTPREGLVLHELGYDGRPIIYRASLAEMFVPYGDPAPTHRYKNVFDQGEYWSAGSRTRSPSAATASARSSTSTASSTTRTASRPRSRTRSACTRSDFGIGWKHTDFRTEDVEVRRLRRLVISSIATVGNYEYGYFWYLYTDGTIEYEVKLSGVISTGALEPGARPAHGTLVAPGLYGPHHQHFFCVRLDMAVDGNANTVVQVDSEPLPYGPENPTGTAWVTKCTVYADESALGRSTRCGDASADREPGQAERARRSRRLQARPG